jgi:probable F420-dependent oxidoreductase
MLIGFNAPTAGPLSAADNLAKIVVGAEAMGFDYATFSDHIVIPTAIAAEYPYSASGEFPSGTRGERHEQLTEIAWIAAKTTRLRLVTSVMVVPHRPAVLTAKILSTIDVLSGGRLTLGIGAGWMREEFEAIDAPDFDARGTVTDEYVRAFVELWTKDAPKFDGKHVRFSNIGFAPKPVQKPHPPIWVGGHTEPALRRTALLGDAWHPIGLRGPAGLAPDELGEKVARIRTLASQAGRNPASIGVAFRGPLDLWPARGKTPDEARQNALTLSLEGVAQNITCPLFIVNGRLDRIVSDLFHITHPSGLTLTDGNLPEIADRAILSLRPLIKDKKKRYDGYNRKASSRFHRGEQLLQLAWT